MKRRKKTEQSFACLHSLTKNDPYTQSAINLTIDKQDLYVCGDITTTILDILVLFFI
jgi:hypothetical protein